MTIAQQHKEFKIRLNRVDSNHDQDFLPWEIDSFLNRAALFMLDHYGELREFGKGQFHKDLLAPFTIVYPEQEELPLTVVDTTLYEVPFSSLKYDYHHLIRAYFHLNDINIEVSILPLDKISLSEDAITGSDLKWGKLIGYIGKSSMEDSSSLYLRSSDDLSTKRIRLEYVRIPKAVFYGGYDTIEYLRCVQLGGGQSECGQYYNANTDPVDSEFPSSYHSLQVDIAVYLASGSIGNIPLSQFLERTINSLPN